MSRILVIGTTPTHEQTAIVVLTIHLLYEYTKFAISFHARVDRVRLLRLRLIFGVKHGEVAFHVVARGEPRRALRHRAHERLLVLAELVLREVLVLDELLVAEVARESTIIRVLSLVHLQVAFSSELLVAMVTLEPLVSMFLLTSIRQHKQSLTGSCIPPEPYSCRCVERKMDEQMPPQFFRIARTMQNRKAYTGH